MDIRETWIGEMESGDVLVSARFASDAPPSADGMEAAMRLINASHALDPLSPADLYIFPADMSTDALDSHFSRMDGSTLQNYVADARTGVPFMNSHGRAFPLGHTFDGEYSDTGTSRVAKAQIYMQRGLSPNGDASPSTDATWQMIRGGTLRDGSVGFYGGQSVCDVCGFDVRDYENCPHIPGTTHKTRDGIVASYTVKNARLREFSAVYAGSTPGAMFSRSALDKTMFGIGQRSLARAEVSRLEDKYGLLLTDSRTTYSIPAPTRKGSDMTTKNTIDSLLSSSSVKLPPEVRTALEETRASLTDADTDLKPVLVQMERLADICHARGELLATLPTVKDAESARALAKQAEDGKAFRSTLIEDALQEGTRAQGEDFAADTYKSILEGRSIDEIKTLKAGWEKAANARLAGFNEDGTPKESGGRSTVPADGLEHFKTKNGSTAPSLVGTANNYK